MKTSNKILLATLLGILACAISTMAYVRANTVVGSPVTAEGNISKRYYKMGDLNTLIIENGRVTLYQGEPYVEIKCADNIHQYINPEVKDGTLSLEIRQGQYNNIGDIDIVISTRDIKDIFLRGGASLSAENTFKTDVINLSAQNSTSINLPLDANIVNVSSTEGGKITLSGQSNIMNASVRNSGNINASNLETNLVTAKVSEGSKLITTVKENLEVDVSNSGEILYRGDPEIKINTQTDSGRITKL